MARIEIKFPEDKIVFKTTIAVLVNHLNYGNHLGYDSLLSILQEARMRFLKLHNMSELTIDTNIGYFVVDVALSYKAEAFHGDELEIELGVTDITKKSCDFTYRIRNLTTTKTVAIAKTGVCFYDRLNKKIVSVPLPFLKAVEGSKP